MALAYHTTVSTSATLLATGGSGGTFGSSFLIRVPSGGVTLSVGASDVTTSAGFDVVSGEPLVVDLDPGETIYGIVATGTQAVHVLACSP